MGTEEKVGIGERNKRFTLPMRTKVVLGGSAFFCYFLIMALISTPMLSYQLTASISYGPQIIWEKTYGEIGESSISDIIQDGEEFIVVGTANIPSNKSYYDPYRHDVYILKIDGEGNKLWEKTYGREAITETGRSIAISSDGGYVTLGRTYRALEPSASYLYVLKVSSEGDKEWERKYGNRTTRDMGDEVISTREGGFLLLGTIYIFPGYEGSNYLYPNQNVHIIKIDFEGNTIWEKTYPTPGGDSANSLISTDDGGYLFTVNDQSMQGYEAPMNRKIRCQKIDGQGNLLWTKSFRGDAPRFADDIKQTLDGGYVILGVTLTEEPPYSVNDLFLLKIDTNGSVIWEKTYQTLNQESPNCLIETDDGGFIVVGRALEQEWHTYLVRFDQDGYKIWEKNLKGSEQVYMSGIARSGEGEYILAGRIQSPDGDGYNVHLIKIFDPVFTPVDEILSAPLAFAPALLILLSLMCLYLYRMRTKRGSVNE